MTHKGLAVLARIGAVLLALAGVLGTFARADDGLPPPIGGESSVPRGLFLSANIGVILTADRAAIGVVPGDPEWIDRYLHASATFLNWVDETLEGSFTGVGKPSGFELGPPATVGLALGLAFRPGWECELGVASYSGEARAVAPVGIETDAGPIALRGEIKTSLRGLVADAMMRKRWRIGSNVPQVGAGIRMHRLSPQDCRIAIESIQVYVAPPGAHSEFSPIVEIGFGRAIGEKFMLGLAGEFSGRSLPEESGAESWVLEPEIRIWGCFKLAPDRR
jgi:hypothetical protein